MKRSTLYAIVSYLVFGVIAIAMLPFTFVVMMFGSDDPHVSVFMVILFVLLLLLYMVTYLASFIDGISMLRRGKSAVKVSLLPGIPLALSLILFLAILLI